MKHSYYSLLLSFFLVLSFSCGSGGSMKVSGESSRSFSDKSAKSDVSSRVEKKRMAEVDAIKSEEASPVDIKKNTNQENQDGLLTAGEWNDLDNWEFWTKIISDTQWKGMQKTWQFNLTQHIPVLLIDASGKPANDINIELQNSKNEPIWQAKTDIFGRAVLFSAIFKETQDNFRLVITLPDGKKITQSKFSFNKENKYNIAQINKNSDNLDIMFVVDATGSMGDEMSFLETELKSISKKIKEQSPGLHSRTGLVFYRDKGDEYLTRDFDFSADINTVLANISNQAPGGGGDFPEAVEAGLDAALSGKSWSENAKARLLFLILDAPPHNNPETIIKMQNAIKKAAQKGIKVIPVVASGIDKPTEFIMRFSSIATNSTYVFLTDDSGIGESHLVPTVGKYEVEFLNDLIVRLVMKYTGNLGS